jgi:hypothetical protein
VPELVASIGIISAASISAISAVLVARLRLDYRNQNGTQVDLLREINKRTTRIEERVNDHGERIATIEGRQAAQ